jgi:glycosyltransferase involved in cell wall biosynthesis
MLQPLAHRYDIHQFSFGRTNATNHPWPLHCNPDRTDVYGVAALSKLIGDLQPDLLLIVFDIWLYYAYRSMLKQRFPGMPAVLYCPIDGDEARPAYIQGLADLDCLVLFTDFARRVVAQAISGPGGEAPSHIEVIPHGIDPGAFRPAACDPNGNPDPTASRIAARRKLFRDRPELEDSFLVLNANQNNGRKRFDLTLEGFARFAADKPQRVKLYLHTRLDEKGCELLPIARRLGVQDRLLWTNSPTDGHYVSDERLGLIYNACDVGLNTSVGEGWGLVAFEHAATAAAQILPHNSVHEELWVGAADLAEAGHPVRGRHDFVTHRLVDPKAVAVALDRLYSDPGLLRQRSLDAFHRATSPDLSWARIAGKWDSLFQRLLKQPRPQ